ncbi:MAG: hypothetical protein AAFR36_32415 [Bacteroidota bacterium]
MNPTSAATPEQTAIERLLTEQNQLLREQLQAFKREREAATWSHREMIYMQRQMLPLELQPEWVTIDEAAFLLGLRLFPSLYHRRIVNWLQRNGELITTRGQRPMDFLRKEVLEANKRIIDGTVVLPSTL